MLDRWKKLNKKQQMALLGSLAGILLALVVLVGIVMVISGDRSGHASLGTEPSESVSSELTQEDESITESQEIEDTSTEEVSTGTEDLSEETEETEKQEDPQGSMDGNMNEESGADVEINDVLENLPNDNETMEITYGIDVSKYQGTIDWKQVAESGIDFAMIRVGYRTLKTGEILADNNAKYNMQEAAKYGIKVGVYFFSTAVTEKEAIEEADWVSNYIAKYQITYPVVYNCERFEEPENRQYSLTKAQRTNFAIAFLERIIENGYSPMFYAGMNELENDTKWETSRLEGKFKIWVAQYPDKPYPDTTKSSYSGEHDMWQYTNNGKVPGVKGSVDMNVAYFGFRDVEGPQDTEKPDDEKADIEALMNFEEVNETVTAKERTNLRDIPSQGEDSNVMYTLKNGETATRTGISDTGWSRVVFNGKTYYAVSSYLTTDLSYQPPQDTEEPPTDTETETEGGIKTQFKDVDELVTAKDAVNLRNIPSVTNEDSQVVVTLLNGEVVKRTGINEDLGWSRVEYNGQVLYCVSSYLELVEE
ncbi:MAG: glycoside hydrolase family 25 [Agathobacter sp.]|nr:glycoside hydrolase family 25 [Agathobacter sp.]